MKQIYAILLMMLLPLAASAQRNGNRENVEKELHEYKLKYLAQEMELRADQQSRFFEVYNRMTKKKRKVFRTAVEMERKVKNDKNASAADYQRATDAMSEAKIKEGQIDQRYEDEFNKFLTPKQIYQMKEAEKKFRQKMSQLRGKKRR